MPRLVRIDGSYINPDFVVAIYEADGGRRSRMVMTLGPDIMALQPPYKIAALLNPPPAPDDEPL